MPDSSAALKIRIAISLLFAAKILLIFFLIIGIIIIYNFRGHNQNKAIEACIAGSKKLDTPMTVEEAKEFCKQKIQNKQ